MRRLESGFGHGVRVVGLGASEENVGDEREVGRHKESEKRKRHETGTWGYRRGGSKKGKLKNEIVKF
ncbi:hypothetical protein ACOSQ2_032012 [Xanthoceras sorbifolium]